MLITFLIILTLGLILCAGGVYYGAQIESQGLILFSGISIIILISVCTFGISITRPTYTYSCKDGSQPFYIKRSGYWCGVLVPADSHKN